MPELFESGHVSYKAFSLFASGKLSIEEKDALLAHASECSRCALALASVLEDGRLAEPPASFLEDTMQKIYFADGKTSQKSYYSYCLRVGLAVCASIALVFSGVFDRIPIRLDIPSASHGSAYAQRLTDGIRNFSDKLVRLEVFENDQQTQ